MEYSDEEEGKDKQGEGARERISTTDFVCQSGGTQSGHLAPRILASPRSDNEEIECTHSSAPREDRIL